MSSFLEMLSNRIEAHRKRLNIKQDAFAALAKVPLRTYSDIVSGNRDPKASQIVSVAKALGVTPNDLLLGDKPAMTPDFTPKPAQTVAQMTPAELEALVARASKRDNTINLENARLRAEINRIPPVVFEKWSDANAETKALCIYLLSHDRPFLEGLPPEIQAKILAVAQTLGLKTPAKPS